MKKTVIIAVLLLLFILIVAGVAGILSIAKTGEKLDSESRQYVQASFPVIASNWDPQEIVKRSSTEFTAAYKPSDLESWCSAYRKLGKLKAVRSIDGEANISIINGVKLIQAKYIINADFTAGSAYIQMNLIKKADQWQICGFYVKTQK